MPTAASGCARILLELGHLVPAGGDSLGGQGLRLVGQPTDGRALLALGGATAVSPSCFTAFDDGGHLAAQRREIGLEFAQIVVRGLAAARRCVLSGMPRRSHSGGWCSLPAGCTLLHPG